MFVDHLQLADFRSYTTVDVPLNAGVSTFVGANGQGKTNLVEAIEYLSTLSSHRVATDHHHWLPDLEVELGYVYQSPAVSCADGSESTAGHVDRRTARGLPASPMTRAGTCSMGSAARLTASTRSIQPTPP